MNSPDKKELRILIVEDDTANARALERLLSRYGACCVAGDGQEAIDTIQHAFDNQSPMNLICLDLGLPSVEGYEVLRQLRALEREMGKSEEEFTTVIITTSDHHPRRMATAFMEGCQGYLIKPFVQCQIEETLHSLGII